MQRQHHHQAADAAGLAAPNAALNDEGSGANRTPLENNQPNDSAATAPACLDKSAARKPWLNVQARCLLAGFTAALIDDDAGRPVLLVSRWALTRSFSSVADADAWLSRVKGDAQ
jgi:hypothetical protein